jgi:hypothetical protein
MSYWIPPDEDWVRSMVEIAMIGYKPPEITAEMIGAYSGAPSTEPCNYNNPHCLTAEQLGITKETNHGTSN